MYVDSPTSSVSVTVWGAAELAKQPFASGAQEVIVAVRVLKIGDTETEITGLSVARGVSFSVTAHTVVDAASFVVTNVVLAKAGQSLPPDGQAVAVTVRRVETVKVVYCSLGCGGVPVKVACEVGSLSDTGQIVVVT